MLIVSRARARRLGAFAQGGSVLALGAALMIAAAPAAAAQTQAGPTVPPDPQSPVQAPATGSPTPGAVPATGTPGDAQAPAPAEAAQAGQPDGDAAATPDIVVTGFSAALRSATAKKKNAETVVESVSAEDIGKLPDNGIGESIARLPGISAQRTDGRANIISIRGFGPDFSSTTLNGRQQTTTNDSRAVEFDQYPSEILAGVDVYKTAEADHTAGGIVGTVDLRTIRPLETTARVLAIGARGTLVDQKIDPNSDNKGFRVYGTFVDRFADDKVGVAISAAYTDEPYQTHDFNAWGFGTGGSYPANVIGMGGIKTWSETDKLKRFGGNATLQVQADENTVLTIDTFYSHFVDRIDQRGFEMPFSCGGGCGHDSITNVQTDSNGLAVAATVNGTPIIENYANDRVADQYGVGWNGKYDNHDGWRALADISWSRTDRADSSIQTTAGLGRALPAATATVGYTLSTSGPQFSSNYNGTNPALVLTDVEGWSGSPVQAGYENVRKTKDDLVEARAEVEREVGGFLKSVKLGADFTSRSKGLTAAEAYLSPPNGAATAAIPSNLLLEPVTLDRGLGQIIAYDPRILVPDGVLSYIANNFGATKGYVVRENVLTPYLMGTLDGHLLGATLTGNVGVQGVHSAISSTGQAFPEITDDYWMVLPSANLNLRTNSGFVIRAAASKEMMRARLPDLNNVFSVGIDTGTFPGRAIYNGSGGNPNLRPYQAWAFDLNFEKYFGNRGYIALQTFYKIIDTYVASGIEAYDFANVPNLPVNTGGLNPTTTVGLLSTSVNTHGGNAYGAEVAGTLPFEVFTKSLSGFGLTGGAGYTHTKIIDFNGNVSSIPGYSKWVASLTAFFEKDGFSIRGSGRYRSSYLGDFALYSGGLDRQQVLSEIIADAQVGYDFTGPSFLHGMSIYLQGQNLNNERSATLGNLGAVSDQLAILKYQTYGRRFVAGFTAKF